MALSCGHVSLAPVGAGFRHALPGCGAGGAGGAAVLPVAATHGVRQRTAPPLAG